MPAPMLTPDELAARGYDTVVVAATDIQGRLFGRRVPLRQFLEDPQRDIPVCTCALAWDITQDLAQFTPFAGWHTGWHDFLIRPDLATLRPYPGVAGTAICLADCYDEETNAPLELAPRWVLKRQLERTAKLGYEVLLASELEFYLYYGSIQDARAAGFRGLRPTTVTRSDYSIVGMSVQEPFIARIRRDMDAAGIPIYACQAEFGFGQWEVNLDYSEMLEMADRHVIYKAGVKEIAQQEGMAVTFMAKPVTDDFGSSSHFHCSFRKGDEPVFAGDAHSREPSPLARHFIGGLMERLDETALFFAPFVNSYKRHHGEGVGGGIQAWGFDNRTVTFRVVGHGPSLRVEHRYPGADVNPYLAAAAILAGGLDGIERELDPGPPFKGNAYERKDLARAPVSLGDAVTAFESSEWTKRVFGTAVVEHYAAHGRGEWQGYLAAVTDWEINRTFELV